MPKLLKFVKKTHPVLREVVPPIENFNDPALHKLIKDMCYSILPKQLKLAQGLYKSAAGMAANQWGIRKRIFIFTPDGSAKDKKRIVMINPSYLPHIESANSQPTISSAYEGCFSVPLTTGNVNRYDSIIATYYEPSGKKVEQIMEGWEARVFQHETDHLDGKLFDGKCDNYSGPDCLKRVIFKDKDEQQAFWAALSDD